LTYAEGKELKKQEETNERELKTKSKTNFADMSRNTCIACGREIPEGMLVCKQCEIGASSNRCTICNRAIAESELLCDHCKDVIFRSKQ
jgi:predicted nucleic acid-binding Zn ribbon protein